MVDDEDIYHHLTTMANLADELVKPTSTEVTNEDFMTTMCFSITEIPQYTNIVEIVMNGPVLGRGDFINKSMATE